MARAGPEDMPAPDALDVFLANYDDFGNWIAGNPGVQALDLVGSIENDGHDHVGVVEEASNENNGEDVSAENIAIEEGTSKRPNIAAPDGTDDHESHLFPPFLRDYFAAEETFSHSPTPEQASQQAALQTSVAQTDDDSGEHASTTIRHDEKVTVSTSGAGTSTAEDFSFDSTSFDRCPAYGYSDAFVDSNFGYSPFYDNFSDWFDEKTTSGVGSNQLTNPNSTGEVSHDIERTVHGSEQNTCDHEAGDADNKPDESQTTSTSEISASQVPQTSDSVDAGQDLASSTSEDAETDSESEPPLPDNLDLSCFAPLEPESPLPTCRHDLRYIGIAHYPFLREAPQGFVSEFVAPSLPLTHINPLAIQRAGPHIASTAQQIGSAALATTAATSDGVSASQRLPQPSEESHHRSSVKAAPRAGQAHRQQQGRR